MATGTTIESTIKTRDGVIKNVVIAGTPIFRVVADGYIVFDRKDYTLTRNSNYSYSAPVTGGIITFSSTGITSTFDGYNASGTRVNGASAGYAVSPASLSSNAHNTTSRSGNLTVTQENSQLQVTVPYTQSADAYETVNVCTGLTVTLSNVAVIPASGGSVNSATATVTANGYQRFDWLSGDSTTGSTTSWTLTSSEYTLAWTGVSAQSKGETPSQQTTAGTLTCKATYKANTSITGQGQATVYQQANQIEGYTSYEYELAVSTNVTGTYTSAGGVITVEYSGQRKRKPIYTSKATGSTYQYSDIGCDLTSNYGTIANASVTGTGNTTLTLGANTTGNRTVTITLKYQSDSSKKATTSFTQSYSTSSLAYSYLSNYTGNSIITSWDDVNEVRKEISNWSSPTQSVYAVTADGSTVYRLGNNATYNPVGVDTYFYNVDSKLFKTRVVATAGTQGTEYLWYKNATWNFTGKDTGLTIAASTTYFNITGTTNTSYGVTVSENGNPITSVTAYTTSIRVNCGANTGNTDRTFTITFTENNPTAGNKPTMNAITITQSAPVLSGQFYIVGSSDYGYIITNYNRSGSRQPMNIDHYSTIYDAGQWYSFDTSNPLFYTELNDNDEQDCQTGTTYYVWRWDFNNEAWDTSNVKSFTYNYQSITITF